MNITKRQIIKYALLPGIIPRVRDFFASGFTHISFFMAYAYRAVRLIPDNHPYLNPANTGRFGIRHVLAEARRNLVFSKKNIDQIVFHYTMILGLFLLFLQFAIMALSLTMHAANAATQAGDIGAYYAAFFVTENPEDDIAFILLDYTFGFPDMFNSRVNGLAGWPSPFHEALHTFFNFYNVGILAVGLIIFLYLIVTIVGETAQSGTPFGRRFNKAWAPVRLIVAIGLLTPLTFGMNGAQLITLHVAKWGSSLATNAWIMFNEIVLEQSYTVAGTDAEALVAAPNPPKFNGLLEFMMVAQTCRWTEFYQKDNFYTDEPEVMAYQVYGTQSWELPGDFTTALNNSANHDIIIRFGRKDEEFYKNEKGSVKPTCGEIIIQVKDLSTPGAYRLQENYYQILRNMWFDGPNDSYAQNIARRMLPVIEKDPFAAVPDAIYVDETKEWFNEQIVEAIADAREVEMSDPAWLEDLSFYGWGGAAIWYNKLAQLNGSLIASAYNLPNPMVYPEVMEHVREQRKQKNNFIYGPERFKPFLADGELVQFSSPEDKYSSITLYHTQTFWEDRFVEAENNIIIDTIRALFGLEGLYNMIDNVDTHPLAQLVGVGRSLVESAVSNLGYSFGSGVMGGVLSLLGFTHTGAFGMSAAKFMAQIAMIGLALGLILAYVVPFLPFVYFFFAVGGWVKGLFEAMVGLPLWAIAHVRIDGEGIPGPGGMNGYYLILEIFVRPVLILGGLLAGIIIFAAQVRVLHEIWKLVLTNLTGHDVTSDYGNAITPGETGAVEFLKPTIDQFFYTVIYTIVVYMMAMSSFKLIDLIPKQILRWVGSSVPTFGDQTGDPAGRLLQTTYFGTQAALGDISGAVGGVNSSLTGLIMRN